LATQPQPRRTLGDVSRPKALAQGPREILMDEPAAKPGKQKPSTALALAAVDKAVPPSKSAAAKTAKPSGSAVATRLSEPEKPAPVVAASAADDSPSLSQKIAGLFGGARPAPKEGCASSSRRACRTPAVPCGGSRPAPPQGSCGLPGQAAARFGPRRHGRAEAGRRTYDAGAAGRGVRRPDPRRAAGRAGGHGVRAGELIS